LIIDLDQNIDEVQIMFDKQSTKLNIKKKHQTNILFIYKHTLYEQVISFKIVKRDKARCTHEFGRIRYIH